MTKITIEVNIEEVKWKKALPDVIKIIKQACTAALNSSGITEYVTQIDISVLLTNDKKIQELNDNYRDKNMPTNVLSFPQEDLLSGDYEDLNTNISLGDIIFALETIQSEAIKQGKSFEHHLVHLAIHGTLHLLGYDHEQDEEAEIMESLEIETLDRLGIVNPY